MSSGSRRAIPIPSATTPPSPATSALGSYVLDLAPRRPAWLGPVITSNAPPFAIPLGALVSGTLVQYEPGPRTLIYTIVALVLVVLAVLLALCPETVVRRPGAVASLRPRVLIPSGRARVLFATLYLISYSGAAAPGLVAGRLATFMAPDTIALGYGALVLVCATTAILVSRSSAGAAPAD